MDAALVLFLNQCFIEGWTHAEGVKCLAAIGDSRAELSKNSLPRSRRALQGWKNLDPGTTRPPLAWPLISLIALTMAEMGCMMEAIAVLLMFVIYARPGEVFNIRKRDLVASTSLGQHWALNLHPSEHLQTSRVNVSNETLLLDNQEIPWLGPVLNVISHLPEGPLIPTSYQQLTAAWSQAQTKLKVGNKKAVLYQLRHSRASWDRFRNYREILEVNSEGGGAQTPASKDTNNTPWLLSNSKSCRTKGSSVASSSTCPGTT